MKVELFLFKKSFVKSLGKLDHKVYLEFIKKREMLVTNPRNSLLNLHPLRGEWRGFWSINITGDMRAIFKLQNNVAVFVDIGTHSELYE